MGIMGICQIPFDTFCVFPFCLLVCLTYWLSAAYEKSWDGGLGDMRNPHELALSVMLHSSSCFLVCITYWKSVPYKEIAGWGFEIPPWGFGDFENPHELIFVWFCIFSSFLFVSLTYWDSVPYKEIRGWGFGISPWGFCCQEIPYCSPFNPLVTLPRRIEYLSSWLSVVVAEADRRTGQYGL